MFKTIKFPFIHTENIIRQSHASLKINTVENSINEKKWKSSIVVRKKIIKNGKVIIVSKQNWTCHSHNYSSYLHSSDCSCVSPPYSPIYPKINISLLINICPNHIIISNLKKIWSKLFPLLNLSEQWLLLGSMHRCQIMYRSTLFGIMSRISVDWIHF